MEGVVEGQTNAQGIHGSRFPGNMVNTFTQQ
jgi:hypothetical protein